MASYSFMHKNSIIKLIRLLESTYKKKNNIHQNEDNIMQNRLLLLFLLSIFSASVTTADLKDFKAAGASVLPIVELPVDEKGEPIFVDHNNFKNKQLLTPADTINSKTAKFAILGRERKGRDGHRHTFEDFGGKVDPNEKEFPIKAAAREFVEEANAEQVFNLDRAAAEEYLNPANNHIEFIIAQEAAGANLKSGYKGSNYVTYITHFDPSFAQAMINNFPKAIAEATEDEYREKDIIVLVKYEDLLKNIKTHTRKMTGYLLATTGQASTQQTGDSINITLRPVLDHKLWGFAHERSFTQEPNAKIRFYKSPLYKDLPATSENLPDTSKNLPDTATTPDTPWSSYFIRPTFTQASCAALALTAIGCSIALHHYHTAPADTSDKDNKIKDDESDH